MLSHRTRQIIYYATLPVAVPIAFVAVLTVMAFDIYDERQLRKVEKEENTHAAQIIRDNRA